MSNPNKNFRNDTSMESRRLTFVENFGGIELEVVLPATTEVRIRHGLRNGKVPSRYLVLSQTGDGQIRKGPTEWDENYAYFENSTADDLTAIVVLLP